MEVIKHIGFGGTRPNDIDYKRQTNGFAEVWLYDNIHEEDEGYFADGVNFMTKLTADEVLRQKSVYFKEDSAVSLEEQVARQQELINLLISKNGYAVNEISKGALELVKDDKNTNEDGINVPITYKSGMSVTAGLTYSDGEYIWDCIKSGVPTSFHDKTYFNIIEI